jgi:molecular chaperone DnaK
VPPTRRVDDHHRAVTLDKNDIDQMVRDAEAHAEEDKQRREEAEIRNNADSLVYQTEKVLRDNADKVDEAEKGRGRGAARRAEDGPQRQRHGSHQDRSRGAHAGQPGVQPEAVREGRGRERGTSAATTARATRMPTAATTTIIDAEIVDDEGNKS